MTPFLSVWSYDKYCIIISASNLTQISVVPKKLSEVDGITAIMTTENGSVQVVRHLSSKRRCNGHSVNCVRYADDTFRNL